MLSFFPPEVTMLVGGNGIFQCRGFWLHGQTNWAAHLLGSRAPQAALLTWLGKVGLHASPTFTEMPGLTSKLTPSGLPSVSLLEVFMASGLCLSCFLQPTSLCQLTSLEVFHRSQGSEAWIYLKSCREFVKIQMTRTYTETTDSNRGVGRNWETI